VVTGAGFDGLALLLDGRAVAERALPVAAAWARRLGTSLSLVTAADQLLSRSSLGRERAAGTAISASYSTTVRTTQRDLPMERTRSNPWRSNMAIVPLWMNEDETLRPSMSSG
jgi:hypothetical protein